MKYTKTLFIEKVKDLYNGEIEIVSEFKGILHEIIVKDEFGLMKLSKAQFLLYSRPSIKAAINKTEYFMNCLKKKQPLIYKLVTPASDYIKAKCKMKFNTKYGLIEVNPDSLLSGHIPTVRVAINKEKYMEAQLNELYENKYTFKINSTNRHVGYCTLYCKKHGPVNIDNDYIFSGIGCPKCSRERNDSNILYVVKLSNEIESFYKLGITYRTKSGSLQRYKQYKMLGYNIEEIYIKEYESKEECACTELKLKHIIKNNIFHPQIWPAEKSTETFGETFLNNVLHNI